MFRFLSTSPHYSNITYCLLTGSSFGMALFFLCLTCSIVTCMDNETAKQKGQQMDGLTCLRCGYYHEDYNRLKHYSYDSGGFCRNCDYDHMIADSEREEEEDDE